MDRVGGGVGGESGSALVKAIGPVRAAAITYLNPAVAVIAGVVVLDERVALWTGIGLRLC